MAIQKRTGIKRPRNTLVMNCPNPRCKDVLELTFLGSIYQHFECRSCRTSVEVPIKEARR